MTIPQDQETAVHEAIWNGLIEATPEWWKAAVLRAEWSLDSATQESFPHSISSPEGHKDVVVPTEEITGAVLKLASLYQASGRRWEAVVYSVQLDETGDWDCKVKFSNPSAT